MQIPLGALFCSVVVNSGALYHGKCYLVFYVIAVVCPKQLVECVGVLTKSSSELGCCVD